jgi:hypothetical protein
MSIWSRESLDENPYYYTAFRIARVSRETTRHKVIVKRVGSTRRIIDRDPDQHQIQGKAVTEADVNVAEQVLVDAHRRIEEELIEHAAEELPLKQLHALSQRAAQAMAVNEQIQLPVTNLEALRPWAARVVEQFLDGQPASSALFGALELDIVPPFGREE